MSETFLHPTPDQIAAVSADPAYREAGRHRTAALADSRLYLTLPGRRA
jgi:hypothetical protein